MGKLKVDLQSLPWLLPLAFLGVFYFYPLGSILRYSLAEGDQTASALAALSDPYVLRTLWFTIWQAALSTLLTLLVGLPGAYLIGRYRFRGKALLRALTAIPFIMPTVVVAAGFNALLGGRGWINLGLMRALQLETPPLLIINTLWAILLAHVFYNTTIVMRLVGDFWARLDPRMTQAARTLGATSWRTFTHITVPLLSPAVLTAAMLVFIFNFTSIYIIDMNQSTPVTNNNFILTIIIQINDKWTSSYSAGCCYRKSSLIQTHINSTIFKCLIIGKTATKSTNLNIKNNLT